MAKRKESDSEYPNEDWDYSIAIPNEEFGTNSTPNQEPQILSESLQELHHDSEVSQETNHLEVSNSPFNESEEPNFFEETHDDKDLSSSSSEDSDSSSEVSNSSSEDSEDEEYKPSPENEVLEEEDKEEDEEESQEEEQRKEDEEKREEDQEEYLVEEIIGRKTCRNGIFYHIKWVGFSETTWEPISHLHGCKEALAAFHSKKEVSLSAFTFSYLQRFPSLNPLVNWALSGSTENKIAQFKGTATHVATFLCQEHDLSLESLAKKFATISLPLSDYNFSIKLWTFYKSIHENPQTRRNHSSFLRDLFSYLVSQERDRALICLLGTVLEFWKKECRFWSNQANKYRARKRTRSSMQKRKKYLDQECMKSLGQLALESLNSIQSKPSTELDKENYFEYMNCLLWLIGSSLAWPRNGILAGLTLDQTICQFNSTNDLIPSEEKNGHHWMLDPSKIKNFGQGERGFPKLYPIPLELNPYIRFYLDEVRPFLLNSFTNAFWINRKGKPLSDNSCREIIRTLIMNWTGSNMTIRDIRLNNNANYWRSGPTSHEERLYWNYLMDHSAETANQYYEIWESEEWAHKGAEIPHPYVVTSILLLLFTFDFRFSPSLLKVERANFYSSTNSCSIQ